MKTRKFITSISTVVGVLLILSSVAVIAFSQFSLQKYANESKEIVAQINKLLPEKSIGCVEERSSYSMPVLEINGEDFIGLIDISGTERQLPICGLWNDESVKKYPCRYTGSAYDNTLIIGGYDNYEQFSIIKTLAIGQVVKITDVFGSVFAYTVKSIDVSPQATEEKLKNNKYNLSLFVKDMETNNYIIVRCNLK